MEFEQLVANHYAGLYRFAFSLSQNEADAADLTQQTFLRWATRGFQLRDRSKAKTWLFTTLYREFLGNQRRTTRFPHLDLGDAERELPVTEANAAETMDRQSALAALAQLDDIFRAPLTLFYLQDHSYQEIAEILGVPIGTVMSRLSRGKAQLKERLSNMAADGSEKVIPFRPARRRTS